MILKIKRLIDNYEESPHGILIVMGVLCCDLLI
jgi:hypothetical protein